MDDDPVLLADGACAILANEIRRSSQGSRDLRRMGVRAKAQRIDNTRVADSARRPGCNKIIDLLSDQQVTLHAWR